MRLTISEAARLAGVSVRTLHYYDEIGLFIPSEVDDDNGYRYYDCNSMAQLQQILFLKELEFPLKEIEKMMKSQSYSQQEAMMKQRELLILKKNRLESLIDLLEKSMKGEKIMSFQEFNMEEIDRKKEEYAKEAAEKWGATEAYQQYEKKSKNYSGKNYDDINEGMNLLIQEFSKHVGETPESASVQELVQKWQQYITDNYYECTKQILAGLGQMYVADERFLKNMNRYKEGTAELMSEAIAVFCS